MPIAKQLPSLPVMHNCIMKKSLTNKIKVMWPFLPTDQHKRLLDKPMLKKDDIRSNFFENLL